MRKTKMHLCLAVLGTALVATGTSFARSSVSAIEPQVCGIKQIQVDRLDAVLKHILTPEGGQYRHRGAPVVKLNENTFLRGGIDGVVVFDNAGKVYGTGGVFPGKLTLTTKGPVLWREQGVFSIENDKWKYVFTTENKIVSVLPQGLVLQESDGILFYSDLSGNLVKQSR